MAATARALRAFLLLAGFYVMGLLLLALIVGIDAFVVYEMFHGEFRLGMLYILGGSLMVTLPIIDGMFILGRRGPKEGPQGYELTPDAQPELWAEVREAARVAGTRAPDQVVLVGDVNAAVSERTRLLGLIPGRRSLYLGVPLLEGLTVPRLRGVLAHEFGHYGHHDTRLSAITLRGRVAIGHTIDQFRAGAADSGRAFVLVGNLYIRYGRLYLRASQSVARRQELAADHRAALSVGRDATANALRQVPLLAAAFGFYVEHYASIGWNAGLLPPPGEFYGGFRHLLAEPGRAEELAALQAESPQEPPSPYDSHPPMDERVRLLEALPDDGAGDDASAPAALTLLRDESAVLAGVEAASLTEEAKAMRRLPWDDLVQRASWSEATKAAEPLRQAVFAVRRGPDGNLPTLDETLDAIDAGLLWTQVAPRLAPAGAAADGSARDAVRPGVRAGLAALAQLSLAHAGMARWRLSWAGAPVRFALPASVGDQALDAALDAACADTPDTAPLRGLLAARPTAAAAAAPDPLG
ncbi:M48 family metallopeptidase [Streptomyces sp. V4-01]|uniref:M48 family metallopeptidase n=1 Tax=Actinacidiphila polyblastidii TaxID=3110430 RepID=A0ABU7PCM4_9ACTN|nr:M48 family metallopeptidase [Streptomyces sp. V4-01]